MQRAVQCPAAEEVHAAGAQLAGTGTRQHEAWRGRFLKDGVDNGEQFRRALDFIDDYCALVGRTGKQFPKTLGAGDEGAKQRGIQQVQVQGFRETIAQQRGLAGASGAEQEAALLWKGEKSMQKVHFRAEI